MFKAFPGLAVLFFLFSVVSPQGWAQQSTDVAPRSDVTECLVGSFGMAGQYDIVGLHAGGVVGYYDLPYLVVETSSTLSVNDFDIIPSLSGEETLAVVSSVGLEELKLNGWSAPTHTLLESSWAGALRVVVEDFDGNGYQDFAVLDSDGVTVRVRFFTGTGPLDNSFVVSGPVLDIDSVQWDNTGAIDLVVNTDAGLSVCNIVNGTVIDSFASTDSSLDTFVVVPDGAGTSDQIAWFTKSTAGPNQDMLLLESGVGVRQVLAMGNDRVALGVGADLSGDGLVDLVLNRSNAYEILVLKNRGTTRPFSRIPVHVARFQSGLGTTPVSNKARPTVFDFDHDGILDLHVVVEDDSERVFWSNPFDLTPSNNGSSLAIKQSDMVARIVPDMDSQTDADDGAEADIKLIGSFGTYEIIVWKQEDGQPIDPNPTSVCTNFPVENDGTDPNVDSFIQGPPSIPGMDDQDAYHYAVITPTGFGGRAIGPTVIAAMSFNLDVEQLPHNNWGEAVELELSENIPVNTTIGALTWLQEISILGTPTEEPPGCFDREDT